jgi:excisionase family DNA binding protein
VTRTNPTPLSYRPEVAASVLGVSRAKLYKMIAKGDLKSYKLGTATLIRHEDLAKLLDGAELSPSTKAAQTSMR